MTTSAVMIADMAILVGIFLLGLLAKLFPKKQGTGIREQGSELIVQPCSADGKTSVQLIIHC